MVNKLKLTDDEILLLRELISKYLKDKEYNLKQKTEADKKKQIYETKRGIKH